MKAPWTQPDIRLTTARSKGAGRGVLSLTGRGSGAVRRHGGAPRVSDLPTRRMAAADYMAGPALEQRPKRVEQKRYLNEGCLKRSWELALYLATAR